MSSCWVNLTNIKFIFTKFWNLFNKFHNFAAKRFSRFRNAQFASNDCREYAGHVCSLSKLYLIRRHIFLGPSRIWSTMAQFKKNPLGALMLCKEKYGPVVGLKIGEFR